MLYQLSYLATRGNSCSGETKNHSMTRGFGWSSFEFGVVDGVLGSWAFVLGPFFVLGPESGSFGGPGTKSWLRNEESQPQNPPRTQSLLGFRRAQRVRRLIVKRALRTKTSEPRTISHSELKTALKPDDTHEA